MAAFNNASLYSTGLPLQLRACDIIHTSLQTLEDCGKPLESIDSSMGRTACWPLQCFASTGCVQSKTIPELHTKWDSKMGFKMGQNIDQKHRPKLEPKVGAKSWSPKLEPEVGTICLFTVQNDIRPTCVFTPILDPFLTTQNDSFDNQF